MKLDALVDAAISEAPDLAPLRPVVEKELLHYEILRALDQAGLLDQLTFQGGTSLRLCHGAPRFSEDLDFAGGPAFAAGDVEGMARAIESLIERDFGLDVRVKAPTGKQESERTADVAVSRWQVIVTTAPARPDLPRQRIRLEIANVPAYSSELRPLRRNYAALPDGYEDILVPVGSLSEVLCDKLIAVVASRLTRHRDLWDLPWLQQQGATIDPEWLRAKVADYGLIDYQGALGRRLAVLPDDINAEAFSAQMARFLPPAVIERTIARRGFLDYLVSANQSLLEQARAAVVD
ncbi:nucleotidyl transferase AbiEii/AbiGii toxin family protein [Spiribacter pallidus]|uniref:nucleotidyl transferase AbiEii/AbiGii toxin family protein n=1 Tax=Spiribacter pallidus TaxID=1987936 RepID=UPI00349FE920